MRTPTPLHLYVHIPFCVHKCHYCDFNSHQRKEPAWHAYQQALIAELKYWLNTPQFRGRTLSTVFFGGGTPSLAPPELIESIIETAASVAGMEEQVEITLEANPGTVDANHFKAYRQAGINRLSIGVQSLNNTELHWLERIHNRDEAMQAFHIAREAGFDNINLDLMYGLPGQRLADWLKTLQTAIRLKPEHLSCYQLTIEPHTKLAKKHSAEPCELPDDNTALSMLFETRSLLGEADFNAYEISNFSRSGLKCRHNDAYWLYHDYIGIGAGASGKWDTKALGIVRYSNKRSPESYIDWVQHRKQAVNSEDSLNIQQAAAEAFWLGLRRTDGINRAAFQTRFGFDAWHHFSDALEPWHRQGKLAVTETSISLTEQGLSVADSIASSVL